MEGRLMQDFSQTSRKCRKEYREGRSIKEAVAVIVNRMKIMESSALASFTVVHEDLYHLQNQYWTTLMHVLFV
jgi:hypothetical protein